MKRSFVSFLMGMILILLAFQAHYVSSVPSGSLNGHITVNINITIVNTAPFPKFLVLNPNYNITVYRLNNEETSAGFDSNRRMIFNYNPGIWLMPYETVKINFVITRDESYSLPQVPCSGSGGNSLACGIVVPQLINSPTQLSARSMFPLLDGHIKLLEYEGEVSYLVSSSDEFLKSFAVTLPVIFVDGNMSDFYPQYTMNYSDYVDVLYRYTGLEKRIGNWNGSGESEIQMFDNMFELTDNLLTGVEPPVPVYESRVDDYRDIPVWFVTTSGEFEMSYRVTWKDGGCDE